MATITQAVSDDLANNIVAGDWVITGSGNVYAREDTGSIDFRSGQKLVIMSDFTGDIDLYVGGGGGIDDEPGTGVYGEPFIITNGGGQVNCGTIALKGIRNFKVTSKYDPENLTGHEDYLGHLGGYANSAGTYGIVANFILVNKDIWAGDSENLGADGYHNSASRDGEIEYVELAGEGSSGFSTLQIKNDDLADSEGYMGVMRIHNVYSHDSYEGETLYLGSTQGADQCSAEWHIYNNRFCRAAVECFQLGKIGARSRIYNNVSYLSALDFLFPFQQSQDSNLQLGARNGDVIVEYNLFLGGTANTFFGDGTSDVYTYNGENVIIRKNAFIGVRGVWGGYMAGSGSGNGMLFEFNDNYWMGFDFHYDRMDSVTASNDTINGSNTNDEFRFLNNKTTRSNFVGSSYLSNGNVESINNLVSQDNEVPEFVNDGYTALGIAWTEIEKYADSVTGTGGSEDTNPITYPVGWGVIHNNVNYIVTTEVSQVEPGVDGGWETYYTELFSGNFPPDDLRLVADNFFNLKGIGLLDNIPNSVTQYKWQVADDGIGTNVADIPSSNTRTFDPVKFRIPTGKYIRFAVIVRSNDDRLDNTWRYSDWIELT